ncbi:unnamed protein product [Adineta steineri]|uniref:F-box domain-containing protein n=1 Tax=Adineta steineri TaxID=433720 RepID=A0A814D6J0_9BILA|nr:unnamed protein product [Adineta steineri]
MIGKLENLPNEILLMIFSNIKWFEMIESFWSLNQQFNSLIGFKISGDNGINISEECLYFNKYYKILSSTLFNSLSCIPYIKWIRIDGRNSSCCDIISQWIFDGNILRFINLKKLILIECYVIEKLIENLSLLIEHQLDELILRFDKDIFKISHHERSSGIIACNQEPKLMLMFKEFLRELFSVKCQLTSIELDISDDDFSTNIHRSYSLSIGAHSNVINNELITHCMNLRYLHIHLIYGYILEYIIQRTPALEILSVQFKDGLVKQSSYELQLQQFVPNLFNCRSMGLENSNAESSSPSADELETREIEPFISTIATDENSSSASVMRKTAFLYHCASLQTDYFLIPKLKCFIIKSVIINDSQLNYLKWILNNVNYIEKLKIRLDIKKSVEENFIVNRNIIYKYFLPDVSRNLLDFDFYIASKCKSLLSNDIHRIINSFKTDRFFVNHIFTNVQCVFDPVMSYQYLSSTRIINPKRFDGMM